ncbi:30S ribosomal protein S8 [bacterium]|jgi:small subunit ribosomal protein S8|nr:30S ribosomal protein S8 [bacterium]
MSIDSIGNFLTIVRNGLMVSKRFVIAPYSKMRHSISKILLQEGFIRDIETVEEDSKKYIKVFLKYVDGERVIHEITRISKPSRRCYVASKNMKSVKGGLGLSILSTSNGIMTDKKAKAMAKEGSPVGGEIICTVW